MTFVEALKSGVQFRHPDWTNEKLYLSIIDKEIRWVSNGIVSTTSVYMLTAKQMTSDSWEIEKLEIAQYGLGFKIDMRGATRTRTGVQYLIDEAKTHQKAINELHSKRIMGDFITDCICDKDQVLYRGCKCGGN